MEGLHVSDELPAYSLGILEDTEVQRVRAHLEECAECQKEWAGFRLVVNQLPLGAREMEPPPRVKTRLFERIQKQPVVQADRGRRRVLHFFPS
ncbi:MAG TPA: zf-HC2 domain-containing protein, partial [Anaerolineaceae bacterium]|nr:zf-HC2 domain-containing protein [Anaerolineaceae bacterium]